MKEMNVDRRSILKGLGATGAASAVAAFTTAEAAADDDGYFYGNDNCGIEIKIIDPQTTKIIISEAQNKINGISSRNTAYQLVAGNTYHVVAGLFEGTNQFRAGRAVHQGATSIGQPDTLDAVGAPGHVEDFTVPENVAPGNYNIAYKFGPRTATMNVKVIAKPTSNPDVATLENNWVKPRQGVTVGKEDSTLNNGHLITISGGGLGAAATVKFTLSRKDGQNVSPGMHIKSTVAEGITAQVSDAGLQSDVNIQALPENLTFPVEVNCLAKTLSDNNFSPLTLTDLNGNNLLDKPVGIICK